MKQAMDGVETKESGPGQLSHDERCRRIDRCKCPKPKGQHGNGVWHMRLSELYPDWPGQDIAVEKCPLWLEETMKLIGLQKQKREFENEQVSMAAAGLMTPQERREYEDVQVRIRDVNDRMRASHRKLYRMQHGEDLEPPPRGQQNVLEDEM